MVTSGIVRRGAQVRIFREGAGIHETRIAQLKRFKDDAREVTEGFECGILLEGFNDLREGDVFEVYETREVERRRTSLDDAARAQRPHAGAAAADDELASQRLQPARGLSGFVAILVAELHFPEAGSLKGKRKFVQSAKAQLQNRFGASVAETDHHELWQRSMLTAAFVARGRVSADDLLHRPSDGSTARSGSSSASSWTQVG